MKFLFKSVDETVSMESVKTEDSDRLSEASSPSDSMSGYSKKIGKQQRKKYSKIDDQIRMKLLEDVEKNGDTLKAAAERYNVNYSSAKSIFHIYRKEGRILKKPANERYRRTTLLPSRPNIKIEASVVSDNKVSNNSNLNSLVETDQAIPQFPNMQSFADLLKAAQENSIVQQLQQIQNYLQMTIANQESKNENVQQLFIPKPIRLHDLSRMGQQSSSTPKNKQTSFSRVNK